ncbi:MAG: hypothetical protein H6543_02855 [Prevotellaceae bacterium]|nr:hypothetical protein [Prevotellaceae bacterium]
MHKPSLYIFNPQHDLALANYSPYYQAPKSAIIFAHDLVLLPLWYASTHADIIAETADLNWLSEQKKRFNQLVNINTKNSAEYQYIQTWGWDPGVRYNLLQLGVSQTCLPSDEALNKIKELSHRQLAADGMLYLQNTLRDINFPEPAVRLSTLDAVMNFTTKHPEIVLKAPYSGSGKGLYWNKGSLTKSLSGWCKRTIAKQGCVMGEEALNKIENFAMEFYSNEQGHIVFSGYSLFQTDDGGIYKNNFLLSDKAIESVLERYIALDTLHSIRHHLIEFFETKIAGHYQGYFGVDMFIYKQVDETFAINPCVEINMRMTMGMVARLFYDHFVKLGKQGIFTIEHGLTEGALSKKHEILTNKYPLIVKDSKIESGYLSLCPINDGTFYSVSVIIN